MFFWIFFVDFSVLENNLKSLCIYKDQKNFDFVNINIFFVFLNFYLSIMRILSSFIIMRIVLYITILFAVFYMGKGLISAFSSFHFPKEKAQVESENISEKKEVDHTLQDSTPISLSSISTTSQSKFS